MEGAPCTLLRRSLYRRICTRAPPFTLCRFSNSSVASYPVFVFLLFRADTVAPWKRLYTETQPGSCTSTVAYISYFLARRLRRANFLAEEFARPSRSIKSPSVILTPIKSTDVTNLRIPRNFGPCTLPASPPHPSRSFLRNR